MFYITEDNAYKTLTLTQNRPLFAWEWRKEDIPSLLLYNRSLKLEYIKCSATDDNKQQFKDYCFVCRYDYWLSGVLCGATCLRLRIFGRNRVPVLLRRTQTSTGFCFSDALHKFSWFPDFKNIRAVFAHRMSSALREHQV